MVELVETIATGDRCHYRPIHGTSGRMGT